MYPVSAAKKKHHCTHQLASIEARFSAWEALLDLQPAEMGFPLPTPTHSIPVTMTGGSSTPMQQQQQHHVSFTQSHPGDTSLQSTSFFHDQVRPPKLLFVPSPDKMAMIARLSSTIMSLGQDAFDSGVMMPSFSELSEIAMFCKIPAMEDLLTSGGPSQIFMWIELLREQSRPY